MVEVSKLPNVVDEAAAQAVRLAREVTFGAVGVASVLTRWPLERVTLAGDWKRSRYRHLAGYAGKKSPDNLVVASGFVHPDEVAEDDSEALEERHKVAADRLATTLIRGGVIGGKRQEDEAMPRAVILQPAVLATSPPQELSHLTHSAALVKEAIETHSQKSKPLIESDRPMPLYVAEDALKGNADGIYEPVHRELEVAENVLEDHGADLGFDNKKRPAITLVLFADAVKAARMFKGVRYEHLANGGAARLENPRANQWLPLAHTALPADADKVPRHRFRRTDIDPQPGLLDRRSQNSPVLA